MKVECPECKGEGRYYRCKPLPLPEISNAVSNYAVDATYTYERELIECPKCKGARSVERTERVDVMQEGRKIGTVPPSFDPAAIKSTSFMYDPRPGDFRFDGSAWVASNMLGPGDLEAVPGFVWDREQR